VPVGILDIAPNQLYDPARLRTAAREVMEEVDVPLSKVQGHYNSTHDYRILPLLPPLLHNYTTDLANDGVGT